MARLFTLAVLTALALAALPAAAQETPAVNDPCPAVSNVTVITVDEPFSGEVSPPTEPLLLARSDAGTYLVDLRGVEVGQKVRFDFTLSWSNGTLDGFSDYDMYVNGQWNGGVDSAPETLSLQAGHCQAFNVEIETYLGTPADTVTLDIGKSLF